MPPWVRRVLNDTVEYYSSHRQCAERTMLARERRLLQKKGVPPHCMGKALRRRLGVVRVESVSGKKDTTKPCAQCCAEFAKYGVTFSYLVNGERVVCRADRIKDSILKKSDRQRYSQVRAR